MTEGGKRDFEAGRYAAAEEKFRRAAQAYDAAGDTLNAAEQRNNLSVALLKLHRPQEALDQAAGTDAIFGAANDPRRQGMALNNQAAALQALGKDDEALGAYERSAQYLGEAKENGLRAIVLKEAAALQLRRGRIADSGMHMLGALGVKPNPSIFERILKWLLRILR